MPERTVNHALINYVDADGLPRMAMRRDVVDLPAAEAARLEKLGAVVDGPLGGPVLVPVVEPITPDEPIPTASPVEVSASRRPVDGDAEGTPAAGEKVGEKVGDDKTSGKPGGAGARR